MIRDELVGMESSALKATMDGFLSEDRCVRRSVLSPRGDLAAELEINTTPITMKSFEAITSGLNCAATEKKICVNKNSNFDT